VPIASCVYLLHTNRHNISLESPLHPLSLSNAYDGVGSCERPEALYSAKIEDTCYENSNVLTK
jgi:hypothetical protein